MVRELLSFLSVLLASVSLCAWGAFSGGDERPRSGPSDNQTEPARSWDSLAKEGGVEKCGKVLVARISPNYPIAGETLTLLECVKNISDVPVLVSWDAYGVDQRLVLVRRGDGKALRLRKAKESALYNPHVDELMPGDTPARSGTLSASDST